MALRLTEKSMRQMIKNISDQHYAMTGVVVATTAAHAAALGEACLQISLDNQVDKLAWHDVTGRIEQMVQLKGRLIDWCDQEANMLTEYMALPEVQAETAGQRVFYESAAQISHLCLEAALLLQNFQPLVFEPVQDDLEIAFNLLVGAGQAALLLLDSHLRKCPIPELRQEFEPLQADLSAKIGQLTSGHQPS